MNRILPFEQSPAEATDRQPSQLWLIRAGKEQKAFVAKALELIERLEAWSEREVTPEEVAEVELEARRLGFLQVCAAMRTVGQLLLTYNARAYQHPSTTTAWAPVPTGAARPLSALLLRVYLTGTDVGGDVEREQVQELVAAHMQMILPGGYLKSPQN